MAIVTERTDLDNILLQMIALNIKVDSSFSVHCDIQRPSNTTVYADNDIFNDSFALFKSFDISAVISGGASSKNVVINDIEIISDNPSGLLMPTLFFFNADHIGAISLVDNVAFALDEANLPNYTDFVEILNVKTIANLSYYSNHNNYTIHRLDANGKLYVGVILNNAYIPLNAENLKIQIQGKVI
jgi:hypothetical protein